MKLMTFLQSMNTAQQDLNTILLWVICFLIIGRMVDRFLSKKNDNDK
jgi:hypothetical protein